MKQHSHQDYTTFGMQKLSSVFFVFGLFGYNFITSIFWRFCGEESSTLTTPYRAGMFIFAVGIFVAYLFFKDVLNEKQWNGQLVFFVLLYAVYVFKIMWDLYFDAPAKAGEFFWTTEKFLWFVTIPGVLALAVSYRNIDYCFSAKLAVWLCLIGNFSALYSMHTVFGGEIGRMYVGDGIQLLNSISLGHFGSSGILLGVALWKRERTNVFGRLLLAVLIFEGLFLVVKAGSRGPLIACFGALCFFSFAQSRYALWGAILCVVIVVFISFYYQDIFHFISNISPVLEDRFSETLETGDAGREILWEQAIREFWSHPMGGGYFMVPYLCYSHNMILDAFMAFGVFGVVFVVMLCMAFFKAYQIIHKGDLTYQWIALLFLQFALAAMFSGTFYTNFPLIAVIFVLFSIRDKNTILTDQDVAK